ncbi:hypothetical protein SORBI_3008G025800 [Sorghum bicolor]|uniref:Uncharacterized protein n=1 Tax=Sorghum bicolor TaxID=4558 RepID=A0A1Z5R4J8_SORBI|nr:hypothetical protein SORBI_3008G025800 [Sorghum bicolor]
MHAYYSQQHSTLLLANQKEAGCICMQCMFWNTCICISHGHGWDERWSDSDGEAAVAPCCRCCWAAGGGGDLLPLQLDVAAVAPLGPPRVLDDPVLLPGGRVLPVPNHGDGVVEPAAAPPSVHALPPEVVEVRVAGPDRDDGHHRLLLLLPAGHHRVHQRRLVVHKHTAAMNCRLSRPSGDRLLDDGVATAAATPSSSASVAVVYMAMNSSVVRSVYSVSPSSYEGSSPFLARMYRMLPAYTWKRWRSSEAVA